jgi:hypothetical protein
MQPFWVRALVYGVPFGVLLGLSTSFSSPPTVLRVVIRILVAIVAFGLLMAFQGQTMYTELTEAVAGLDETRRSEAIAAVSHGGVPADSTVRYSAIRLGKAYLRSKSDAQLKRQEWVTWLLLPVFVGLAIFLAATSASKYEADFALVLAFLCVIVLPLGVARQRRIQRNVALLADGVVPQ